MLFTFFNFNGYITSHFTGGHYMWLTYFFFPFFRSLRSISLGAGNPSKRLEELFAGLSGPVHEPTHSTPGSAVRGKSPRPPTSIQA